MIPEDDVLLSRPARKETVTAVRIALIALMGCLLLMVVLMLQARAEPDAMLQRQIKVMDQIEQPQEPVRHAPVIWSAATGETMPEMRTICAGKIRLGGGCDSRSRKAVGSSGGVCAQPGRVVVARTQAASKRRRVIMKMFVSGVFRPNLTPRQSDV